MIYNNYIYTVCTVYFTANLLRYMRFVTKYAKYTVCCGLITKYAVCCKFITKRAVCRNLLANAANLLRNAQFVRIAKDHIRPPRSYGSPQTAVNRNNQPQKKNPDGRGLLKYIIYGRNIYTNNILTSTTYFLYAISIKTH